MDDVDPDAALLVDVLKLATFVGAPLRGGVAEPLGHVTDDNGNAGLYQLADFFAPRIRRRFAFCVVITPRFV